MSEVIIEKKLGIPPDYQYKAIRSRIFLKSNWHKNKLQAINEVCCFDPQTRLLDIGTGSGNLELAVSPRVKEIVGLDYNAEALGFLERCLKKNNFQNVVLKLFDIRDPEYDNLPGQFSVVTMVDVIEHVKSEDAERLLNWLKPLLITDGLVCVITPNYKSPWIIIEKLLDLFSLVPGLSEQQHVIRYDGDSLTTLFNKLGYETVMVTSFNTISFLSPFRKLRQALCRWEINQRSRHGNLLLCLFQKEKKVS